MCIRDSYTGGTPIPLREGLALHAAAVLVTKTMDASTLMPVLDVADQLVASLHLMAFAERSSDLPSGFSARLTLSLIHILILFLDELILWLASRAADVAFVSSEGSKLSKLVEAANADRPVPLISFVARQRDLRELVGNNMAGAMQMEFADVLKYWEERFLKILMADRNLQVIAQAMSLKHI